MGLTMFCRHPESEKETPLPQSCAYCAASTVGIAEKDLPELVWQVFKMRSRSYGGRGCDSCGGIDEPYMLRNEMWRAVKQKGDRFLCLKCVEHRYGRALSEGNFSSAMINFGPIFGLDIRTYLKKKAAGNI